MLEALLFAGLVATAYFGFLLLALSQKQNWKRVWRDVAATVQPPSRQLRIAGSMLLALSLALALFRDGVAFGSILWVIFLCIAGIAVAATLAAWPSRLRLVISVIDTALNGSGPRRRATMAPPPIS